LLARKISALFSSEARLSSRVVSQRLKLMARAFLAFRHDCLWEWKLAKNNDWSQQQRQFSSGKGSFLAGRLTQAQVIEYYAGIARFFATATIVLRQRVA
jgi:hypothetical protein